MADPKKPQQVMYDPNRQTVSPAPQATVSPSQGSMLGGRTTITSADDPRFSGSPAANSAAWNRVTNWLDSWRHPSAGGALTGTIAQTVRQPTPTPTPGAARPTVPAPSPAPVTAAPGPRTPPSNLRVAKVGAGAALNPAAVPTAPVVPPARGGQVPALVSPQRPPAAAGRGSALAQGPIPPAAPKKALPGPATSSYKAPPGTTGGADHNLTELPPSSGGLTELTKEQYDKLTPGASLYGTGTAGIRNIAAASGPNTNVVRKDLPGPINSTDALNYKAADYPNGVQPEGQPFDFGAMVNGAGKALGDFGNALVSKNDSLGGMRPLSLLLAGLAQMADTQGTPGAALVNTLQGFEKSFNSQEEFQHKKAMDERAAGAADVTAASNATQAGASVMNAQTSAIRAGNDFFLGKEGNRLQDQGQKLQYKAAMERIAADKEETAKKLEYEYKALEQDWNKLKLTTAGKGDKDSEYNLLRIADQDWTKADATTITRAEELLKGLPKDPKTGRSSWDNIRAEAANQVIRLGMSGDIAKPEGGFYTPDDFRRFAALYKQSATNPQALQNLSDADKLLVKDVATKIRVNALRLAQDGLRAFNRNEVKDPKPSILDQLNGGM